MKDRLLYIDRLKGFGIFLVVLGHIIQYNMVNATQNALFEAIYSFHMPFFFFLSGYVVNKTTNIESVNSYFSFLKKKAISLLIPLFTWALVVKYCFSSNQDFSLNIFIEIIGKQVMNPGLWFLLMLFEIMIVYSFFHIVSKILNKRISFLLDLVIFSAFIGIILTMNVFIHGMLMSFLLNLCFFFVGVFISKFEIVRSLIQNKWMFFSSGLLFILLVGHYNFSECDLPAMKGLKVIISLLAIAFFYNLSKVLIIPGQLNDFLSYMGRSTLVIYVTQFGFLYILPKTTLIPSETSVILLGLIAIPLSVVLMYLCVGIGKIAETMPVLNLLLYGRPTKYSAIK